MQTTQKITEISTKKKTNNTNHETYITPKKCIDHRITEIIENHNIHKKKTEVTQITGIREITNILKRTEINI